MYEVTDLDFERPVTGAKELNAMSDQRNQKLWDSCGTCGGGGIVCATEASARGAPIGSPLSGPCVVCKGSGVSPWRRTSDPWINYVKLSKTEWQQAIDASTLKASIPFKTSSKVTAVR